MGGYYTLAEIEADLDEMFQLYPNLITQKFLSGQASKAEQSGLLEYRIIQT